MKLKLDEHLSADVADAFGPEHDVHTVSAEGLNGASDRRLLDACQAEGRALVTLDTDFANILVYPPQQFAGLIVLRPGVQTHAAMKEAAAWVRQLLKSERVTNRLWIVEDRRIRVFESD